LQSALKLAIDIPFHAAAYIAKYHPTEAALNPAKSSHRMLIGNYSEGGQKIKKPCPAYFSNDYIENLILNWREN